MEVFVIVIIAILSIIVTLLIAIEGKKRNIDQHNAIINSNQNSDEIVKRLDVIINQQNYLIQLEQQKLYNRQPQNYNNSGFENRQ